MTGLRRLDRDLLTYATGYVLALALTGFAFALVYFHLARPGRALTVILLLGLIQIVVHMRCFLHISLQRSARADLMLILFSTLIIALMTGGTLIILFNLRTRMM
jgi:cytochrome o ubiquinol oxidase operon protein cyoD